MDLQRQGGGPGAGRRGSHPGRRVHLHHQRPRGRRRRPRRPKGLFVRDTRILSRLELRVNGAKPEALAVVSDDPFSAIFVSRCPPRAGLADSTLDGLPPPLRRPGDARGPRDPQLRRRAHVLFGGAVPRLGLRRSLRGQRRTVRNPDGEITRRAPRRRSSSSPTGGARSAGDWSSTSSRPPHSSPTTSSASRRSSPLTASGPAAWSSTP